MTLTKMQAMLGVATGSLIVIGAIVDNRLTDERRFAALDTRLGKLESAIKVLNASTVDERYKQAIKELIAAAEKSGVNYVRKESGTISLAMCSEDGKDWFPCPATPGGVFPADAGAAADLPAGQAGVPAVKVPQ